MLRTSTTLCVLTAAALLAGGIAFADTGMQTLTESKDFIRAALLDETAAPKGDRLMAARAPDNPTSISIVEIVGLTRATVILRDTNGEVLYRSDPRTGITTIAKNTELPVLTLKEDAQSPSVQHPLLPTREGNEEARKPKRQTPVGCMGDVSPLVSASANRMPSLCLADLGQSLL